MDNITAKNYASQVASYVKKYVPNDFDALDKDLYKPVFTDWDLHERAINKSVHFSVPDGACIFNDGLKGLEGSAEYRLPYPQITIETYDNSGKTPYKRLILARETTGSDKALTENDYFTQFIAEEPNFNLDLRYIIIESINSYEKGIWVATPFFCIKPVDRLGPKQTLSIPKSKSHFARSIGLFSNSPHNPLQLKYGNVANYVWDVLKNASLSDCMVVMELIEALNCANVESEPYLNIGSCGRRKKGKNALYETRRLVLNRPGSNNSSLGKSRRSDTVRAHLRRGHIRRLKNPDRNIWVNACAVGNVKNGFAHKDYGVTANAC